MLKLLHTADLHLTRDTPAEMQYSYSVLDEIVEKANEHAADFLVLAGDVFNRFTDIEAGHRDFKERLSKLQKKCEVIYIAGNHENLARKKRKINSYDLGIPAGHVVDSDTAPLQYIEKANVEFLCIPHQDDYAALSEAVVRERSNKVRVAVAHGIVTGTSLEALVDDEDEKAVVIDASFFKKHGVDFVCLGHIHKKTDFKIDGIEAAYPGSPRVWRKGEAGARQVNLIRFEGGRYHKTELALKSAGEYRSVDFALRLDGDSSALSKIADGVGAQDFVYVSLSGIAEVQSVIEKVRREIYETLEARCRRVEVDTSGVQVLAGITQSTLAKKFLAVWEIRNAAAQTDSERRLYLRARELGLLEIKAELEK